MHYVGVDIIEIARIEKAIAHWREGFLNRVYTGMELELYHKKLPSLAARFAGKEAVIKALGIANRRAGWKDIEILADPSGQPLVRLYGRAQEQANGLDLDNLAISLSHSREYAVAFVIGETR